MEEVKKPEGFGSVTAICYIEGNSHANGALAFATSHGYINFILSLSDDLSRSTNRVETFILKGQPNVISMKGLLMESHSEKENETKHVYNFVVNSILGLSSIQCDVGAGTAAAKKASPDPIEIVNTYKKQDDCELNSAMGLYTCFNGGSQMLSLMEDKD